jgi:hypothetical protein
MPHCAAGSIGSSILRGATISRCHSMYEPFVVAPETRRIISRSFTTPRYEQRSRNQRTDDTGGGSADD